MAFCQAKPRPIRACCSSRQRRPRRPAHLCGACGGIGCRCHIAERARQALPLEPVIIDQSRRALSLHHGFAVILAPDVQPLCPQAPPLSRSEPLFMPFGIGINFHGPYS